MVAQRQTTPSTPSSLNLPALVNPFIPADPGASAGIKQIRVGAYRRYSSHKQDNNFTLQAQKRCIVLEATVRAQQGEQWHIEWYTEPARSARAENLAKRVKFLELLNDARAGKFDLVVVHKLDRLARSLSDQSNFIGELKKHGVAFYSIGERVDYATPSSRLNAHLHGAVAEFFSDNLGEEVKKGKRERARAGFHAAHPPFGYRVEVPSDAANATANPLPRRVAVPDRAAGEQDTSAESWEGLQLLFQFLLQGLSDEEVAKRLNAEGRWHLSSPIRLEDDGTPNRRRMFTRNSISRIRCNVFYRPYQPGDDRGTIRDGTDLYRGQHEAAISYSNWQALQETARNRRHGWLGGHKRTDVADTAEFRQLVACAECKRALQYHRTVNPKGTRADPTKTFVYEKYKCQSAQSCLSCSHVRHWAHVDEVRAHWIEYASKYLRLPHDWETHVRHYITQIARGGDRDHLGETPEQAAVRRLKKHHKLMVKKDRLQEMYGDQDIDRTTYKARLADIQRQLEELAAEGAHTREHEAALIDAGRAVAQFRQIADAWPDMTTDERITMANMLIKPKGLVILLLGHTRTTSRNRWEVARGVARPKTCEIVKVQLRPIFEELLVATSNTV